MNNYYQLHSHVGLVTDYAVLWVCFICRLISCFFLYLCSLATTFQHCILFRSTDIFPLVQIYIMAVPPAYSDLGKAAKDIFSKGYGKKTHSVPQKMLLLYKMNCILQQCMCLFCLQVLGLLNWTLRLNLKMEW